jgi:hypothetical protein
MEQGIPFYRALIARHHDAVLAADVDEVMRLHEQAYLLALRLNGGENGICADDDAPACVLARETAAPAGGVPLWGQDGDFVIDVAGMKVRIELNGMFGIGSSHSLWPGFAAHAVDWDKPFLSPTGYRSFLGMHAEPVPGITPDAFAHEAIASHVARELKGKLVMIEQRYRERASGP